MKEGKSMLTYYKRKWLFCGYTICLGMLVVLLTIFQGVMLQIVVDTVAGNLKIHFGYIIAMTILKIMVHITKMPTQFTASYILQVICI